MQSVYFSPSCTYFTPRLPTDPHSLFPPLICIFSNPLSRRREPDTRRPVWTRHRTSAAQDYIDAGSILRGSSEKAAFPQSLPCAMRKKSALSGQPYERPGFNALRFASISLFFSHPRRNIMHDPEKKATVGNGKVPVLVYLGSF
jgi:hypothetical protein